jgi:hypothetical protein
MQYIQLEDGGLGESKFLRGVTAVATGGASEAARGIFGNKKTTPSCSCDAEKSALQKFTMLLRKCKKDTGWSMKQHKANRKIILNPQTGVAQIITPPMNDGAFDLAAGITDLVGGALKATPYGAAASAALNVGKSLFGKKPAGAEGSAGDQIAKLSKAIEDNKKLTLQVDKLKKSNQSLKMQRYYYGGGGFALGIGTGMLMKK